ncbi:MAG: hypothetical protein PHD97_04150 [Bacteroidales bacterium]|nr:hypothetical protein [Bacteroidales bacterium]
MTNYIKITLSFICFFCLISVCYSQQTEKDRLEINIIGEWNWFRSEVCTEEKVLVSTPDTCKCTNKLVFDNSGNMGTYRNDTLLKLSTYRVSPDVSDPSKFILLSNILMGKIYLQNDSLVIKNCEGGGADVFYRKKSFNDKSNAKPQPKKKK